MRASYVLALAFLLSSCTTVTVESPSEHVFALRTGYVATFLTPATAYAELPDCDTNPQPCSDDDVVIALQKADLSAKAALDAAETVVRSNPEVNANFFIDAVEEAIKAARMILSTYDIGE